jgi:hypothetical protein
LRRSVSATNQPVGGRDVSGGLAVNAGSDLTANHILQTSLMIGGTDASAGVVTIAPSDASGNPLDGAQGGSLNSLMMSRGDLMLMAGDRSNGPFPIGEADAPNPLALLDESVRASLAAGAAFLPEARIGGVAAVVPEPATLILLALGGMARVNRATTELPESLKTGAERICENLRNLWMKMIRRFAQILPDLQGVICGSRRERSAGPD